MKKKISIFLILALTLSISITFTACGGNKNEDKFIGVWEEILDTTRVTTVTKDNNKLTWKDQEGSYSAEMKNGKLIVNVGKTTVKITYNSKDDTITSEYLNSKISYKRHIGD